MGIKWWIMTGSGNRSMAFSNWCLAKADNGRKNQLEDFISFLVMVQRKNGWRYLLRLKKLNFLTCIARDTLQDVRAWLIAVLAAGVGTVLKTVPHW